MKRLLSFLAVAALPATASAQPVAWWGVLDDHICMQIASISARLHGPAISTPEDMRQILIRAGSRASPIRPASDHAVVFESTLEGSTKHMYFFDSERLCKAVLVYNGQ